MTRAVVFDLYETLVDYDDARSREFTAAAAALLSRDPDEFHDLWRAGRAVRDTGALAPYLASIGIDGESATQLIALRHETARRLLEPRPGAVATLRELKRRGFRTGLITVCSEDTVDVWPETAFAGLFDAEVFSCSIGIRKPDPAVYLLACERLGVAPRESVFVGDGANDELAGAARVGMRAVMIGDAIADWSGARISCLREILQLV